jgi:hypothetical protein
LIRNPVVLPKIQEEIPRSQRKFLNLSGHQAFTAKTIEAPHAAPAATWDEIWLGGDGEREDSEGGGALSGTGPAHTPSRPRPKQSVLAPPGSPPTQHLLQICPVRFPPFPGIPRLSNPAACSCRTAWYGARARTADRPSESSRTSAPLAPSASASTCGARRATHRSQRHAVETAQSCRKMLGSLSLNTGLCVVKN